MSKTRLVDMGSPMSKYSIEECANMSPKDFDILLERHNEYVNQKSQLLNEETLPQFNSIEEALQYYNALPLDAVLNKTSKLFRV